MIRPKIFIACDTVSSNKINKIIKISRSSKLRISYKIGLEFFLSPKGRSFISKIKGEEIFLDLKLNDIPNTAVSALNAIKDLKNIRYLTIHANGGLEMISNIKKVAKKNNKKLKILAVTVLTSFNEKSIKQIGYSKKIKEIVIKQSKLAEKAKLDGIVCSAHEIKFIKKISKKMEIITPGIRMIKEKFDDQKRVVTPLEAFKKGATGIVVGRSVTKGEIKKNFAKLLNHLS